MTYTVEITPTGDVLLNGEKRGVSDAGEGRLIYKHLEDAETLICVLLGESKTENQD